MKLSELTTESAADVLCEITPHLANIATDEELLEELRRTIDKKGAASKAELLALGIEKVTKLAPLVLKKRRNDVFGILAALNGKDIGDIAKQNFLVTMRQLREIVKDKDLMNFFKSCVDVEGSE